jgi:tetrahydromethanopterin S-methyltransferase subunit F
MNDESRDALRTPLGRERMLEDHEHRIDGIEAEVADIRGKEDNRDKRWDFVVKTVATLCVGIISGVVVALVASGVHP